MYRTHGMSNTRLYKVWADMINRCTNPKLKCYPRYGGRGITVDPRWRASFEAFFADVPPCPSDKHQLDREDNNGNYEPGNVRWVTGKVNCRNARHNHLVEYQGRQITISEAAEITGISKTTIRGRIATGQPDLFAKKKLQRRDFAATEHERKTRMKDANGNKTYNGHKNWNHWNVSLWIANDEGLYRRALELIRSESTKEKAAAAFVAELPAKTPDGAPYSVTTVLAALRGLES